MCLVGNKRAEIARVVPCENSFCTKYAHHFHFCGLQKSNTLNLRHFHPPLNLCNHFSTVLIKTNWYTISCKYCSLQLFDKCRCSIKREMYWKRSLLWLQCFEFCLRICRNCPKYKCECIWWMRLKELHGLCPQGNIRCILVIRMGVFWKYRRVRCH